MNILTISLVSSCNRRCTYCPVQKWLAPLDEWKTWDHPLNNNDLLQWIKRNIDPDKWFLELTGGEPGLYPEIDDLLCALTEQRFFGIVKTNGTCNIKKTKNFPLISAWHLGEEHAPLFFDEILIIKNPQDNWKKKAAYCEEKGIPHKTTMFDPVFEGRKLNEVFCKINKTINCTHINSSGQITECAAGKINKAITIYNKASPIPIRNLVSSCIRCKNIKYLDTP